MCFILMHIESIAGCILPIAVYFFYTPPILYRESRKRIPYLSVHDGRIPTLRNLKQTEIANMQRVILYQINCMHYNKKNKK